MTSASEATGDQTEFYQSLTGKGVEGPTFESECLLKMFPLEGTSISIPGFRPGELLTNSPPCATKFVIWEFRPSPESVNAPISGAGLTVYARSLVWTEQ